VNILAVNWLDLENPQAGGAEVHFFEIFGRLVERGHSVRLVTSGWPGCPTGATIRGISVERVGHRHSFALLGRGAVRRALGAGEPDVLVEDINKLPLYLRGMSRAPFCAIIPHLFGATAFKEASWPAACIVWLAEKLIPRAYRGAGFHAISESTRDDLVLRGIDRNRIEVIHPGVDSVHYGPDAETPRSDPPSFLYVGRLKRYKGIDVAIRALALARKRRPDLVLHVAGGGDDRNRLERLALSLGLGDAVRFHGFVAEQEKLRLLRSCWANIFPSPKEGWGITIIEAAACGTPSLASDSPGLRDSVRHGETGFLVPHGDPEALAGRMVRLADDPAEVARLGSAARGWAESLSWDEAASRTEAHLMSLLRPEKDDQL